MTFGGQTNAASKLTFSTHNLEKLNDSPSGIPQDHSQNKSVWRDSPSHNGPWVHQTFSIFWSINLRKTSFWHPSLKFPSSTPGRLLSYHNIYLSVLSSIHYVTVWFRQILYKHLITQMMILGAVHSVISVLRQLRREDCQKFELAQDTW